MSSKIYNMTDVWNDQATNFTSIKMNTFDIYSDVNSRLLDLRRNGLSEFTVDKLGEIVFGSIDIPRVNLLEESITTLSAAGLAHVDLIAANTLLLAANTSLPNNSIAIVYADPAIQNNDWYYFNNATSTWANTGLLPALAEQLTPRKNVERTVYVSMGGSDSNNGRSIYKPLQTINQALLVANTIINTEGESGGPCVIIVHPGEYQVAPNTEIPRNVTMYGYDARATKLSIASGYEANNMFLMNSGIKVRGFTITGLRHETEWYQNSLYTDPETAKQKSSLDYGPPKYGYAFAFKPGAYITRSPYIGDCAVLHDLTYQQMSAPQDREAGNPLVPMTGGNLYADGSVLDPDSPLRSVVIDSFTAVNPNGVAYSIVNNALVQLVSVFTNWSRVGIWSHAGGQATIVNSNATFGDYAFAATGFRYVVRVDGVADDTKLVPVSNVATYILNNVDDIVNNLMTVRYPTIPDFSTTFLANTVLANLTSRDTRTIVLETAEDLKTGQDKSTIFWVQSLFTSNTSGPYTANSVYTFDPAYLNLFAESWRKIRDELKARTKLVTGTAGANAMIDELFLLANNVILNPQPYTTVFQSKIEAASHQFSYAGSGVNYNALPFGQRASGTPTNPTTNLYQANGGIIYATFNTEQGDTYLGQDLRVDFERSTIEGQAFSRGVQNITLPLIVGIGG